jgi:hypothetical protein
VTEKSVPHSDHRKWVILAAILENGTGKQFLGFISRTVLPIEKLRIGIVLRIGIYTKNVLINIFVRATVERKNQKKTITYLLRAV